MTVKEKPVLRKKIPATKAMLAAMWHLKTAGREKLFSHKYVKVFCDDKHKNTFRSCIFRLCGAELLKKDYNDTFVLTEKGEKQALAAFIEAESAMYKGEMASYRRASAEGDAPIEQWDGGWRMLFFDFPEGKRKYRDYLRKIIRLVGFYEFQRSVWVYPYPVPHFVKDLIFEKNIKPHVRFITTSFVDNDKDLRIIFGLIRPE